MDNQNRKICMKCGVPITPGSAFCTACGAPVSAEERKICTKCGVPIAPGSAFCTACGAPASDSSAPAAPQAAATPEELNKRSYENALKLVEAKQYEAALNLFTKLGDYEDSKKRAEECKAAAEEARKEATYASAVALLSAKNVTEAQLKQAIENLKAMPDYKDSKKQVSNLEKCLDDLVAAKKKKKSKTIKIVIIAAIAFVLLVATAVSLIILNIPHTISLDDTFYCEFNMLSDDIVIPNPERTGYTFIGWSGGYLEEPTKDLVIPKFTWGNYTYYSIWEENEYTITLDPDGGKVDKTSIAVTYNGYYDLPVPEKKGYTFVGWYNGDEYISQTSGTWYNDENWSLKAKWEVKSFNYYLENATTKTLYVTYYLNYGDYKEGVYENITLVNGSTLEHLYYIPQRSGYIFTGWFTDAECTSRYMFEGDITEDLKLYAGWMEMPASDAYQSTQINYAFDDSYNYYSLNLVGTYTTYKSLYIVANKEGTHTVYYANANNNSLYAYNLIVKNVTTGATISTINSISNKSFEAVTFECAAGDVIELIVSRVDHQYSPYAYFYFDGFRLDSTAKHAAKELQFASGYSYQQTINYGEEFTLPEMTRPGYEFLGWYFGDTKIETATWEHLSNVTFVAKWQAKGNTLTLDPNGGSVATNTVSVVYNETFQLPAPARLGYKFNGWYDENGNYFAADEIYTWTLFDDLTLTAEWTQKNFKVVLNNTTTKSYVTVRYNTNNIDALNYDYKKYDLYSGTKLTLPTDPTVTGYLFTGWYTDATCKTKYDFTGTITQDMTLYAGWTKIEMEDTGSDVTYNPANYKYVNGSNVTETPRQYLDNTSSTSKHRVYIVANETGAHSIITHGHSYGTNYSYYFEIYNYTTGEVLWENRLINSANYTEFPITCSKGDIIVISMYRANNSSYSYYPYPSLSFTGFTNPTSTTVTAKGAPSGYTYRSGYTINLNNSLKYGDEITLPTLYREGYKFLGWYYNDTEVKSGKWTLDIDSSYYNITVNLTPKWEEIK